MGYYLSTSGIMSDLVAWDYRSEYDITGRRWGFTYWDAYGAPRVNN